MQQIQRDIAQALQVQPPFQSEADVQRRSPGASPSSSSV